MAKKLLVVLVLMGLIFGGCATYSTRDGVRTPLGALTSAGVNASREGEVIAEYKVILGLVTSGYEEFLEKTKGVEIDVIDTNYIFITTIKAVKR
jgi:outer membrane lipoprotein SlyB